MFKHFFFFCILVFSSDFEEREIILAISFYGEFFSFLIFVNKRAFQWLLVQFISEFTEISGGGFFSPVFGYIYFFSLHENLFLIKKKNKTKCYYHQHFWLLSLVLSVGSKLNWIRINTVRK